MAFTLTMPEVGETVTEGTIERWLKQPGEQIKKYDPIVEVNTDKVNVELPSPVSGTLREIIAKEGETVLVGAALAVIDEVAGETAAEISPAPQKEEAAPVPQQEAAKAPAEREPVAAGAPSVPAPSKAGLPADGAAGGDGARERRPHRATPRVRKLAEELGVSLEALAGSGPGGRIVEEDVRAAASGAPAGTAVQERPAAPTAAAPPEAKPRAPTPPGIEEEAVALTAVRRTIAQRMTQSAFSAPAAWLAVECDVTALVRLRQAKRGAFQERHGIDLTYLPFIAHAVTQTLPEHPYLNASWADDHIVLKRHVHLGIAVATDRGLYVPVIKDADRLSVSGLARAIHDLADRTRANKLQLEEVQGGTFTLDNTGAFGSVISQPIINLGQSAILSMEAITKLPRVIGDDAIAVRSVMAITVSFDHRVMDGHQAGYFLGDVKKRVESFGPDTGID